VALGQMVGQLGLGLGRADAHPPLAIRVDY
jgi:hypothetical protein